MTDTPEQKTIPWGFGEIAYVQLEDFDLAGDGKLVPVIAVQPASGGPAQRIALDSDQAAILRDQHPAIAELTSAPAPADAPAADPTPPPADPTPPAADPAPTPPPAW